MSGAGATLIEMALAMRRSLGEARNAVARGDRERALFHLETLDQQLRFVEGAAAGAARVVVERLTDGAVRAVGRFLGGKKK